MHLRLLPIRKILSAAATGGLQIDDQTHACVMKHPGGGGGDGDQPRLPVTGGNDGEDNNDANVQRTQLITYAYAALIFGADLRSLDCRMQMCER